MTDGTIVVQYERRNPKFLGGALSQKLLHSRTNAHRISSQSHLTPYINLKSPEVQQHEETECYEASQNNSISPFLRSDPPDQAIDPWHLARSPNDPSIDACKRLPLKSKTFINSVRLAQHTVCHGMAIVNPPSLV